MRSAADRSRPGEGGEAGPGFRYRRERNSLDTENSKPGPSDPEPKAHFRSTRSRTASATRRSEGPSANRTTVTGAKCPRGERGSPAPPVARASGRARRSPPTPDPVTIAALVVSTGALIVAGVAIISAEIFVLAAVVSLLGLDLAARRRRPVSTADEPEDRESPLRAARLSGMLLKT